MWPFSTKPKKPTVSPEVRCGDVHAEWNSQWGCWEFVYDGLDFTLRGNPCFDVTIVAELATAMSWIRDQEKAIDSELRKRLDGYCTWTGDKEVVAVDVSRLLEDHEIEVSYAHDDWSYMGVDIVITEGKVTGSYAGD